MSWMVVVIGVVAVLAFVLVVGFVRNVIRLIVALIAGLLVPAIVYWGTSTLGDAEGIPIGIYFALGVISALSVLLKR